MNLKIYIYILVTVFVIIAFDSININAIFKKGRSNYYQARIMYMILIMGISYVVVSFINDFFGVF